MDRLFLDANVLFSAAYLEKSGLRRIWQLEDAELLSSTNAIEEVRRNLLVERPTALFNFEQLLAAIALVNPPAGLTLRADIKLDTKDRPILLAAIYGKADFLLTGDIRHFGRYYGRKFEGVMTLRPADYLNLSQIELKRCPPYRFGAAVCASYR